MKKSFEHDVVMSYFANKDVKQLTEETCGRPIKLTIDEKKRIVRVQGSLSGREWNLDEMVKDLTHE